MTTYFCELWQLLDFDPPTFIIGQMQMESIQLIKCHKIEQFLD